MSCVHILFWREQNFKLLKFLLLTSGRLFQKDIKRESKNILIFTPLSHTLVQLIEFRVIHEH
jgi:hypothetical protein